MNIVNPLSWTSRKYQKDLRGFINKLKLEDKLEIIKLYEDSYSVLMIMEKFNIGRATVNRIERQYREHGIDSFKPKGPKQKIYTGF